MAKSQPITPERRKITHVEAGIERGIDQAGIKTITEDKQMRSTNGES